MANYGLAVTNEVCVLGLDELYRKAMQRHESAELLGLVQQVAGRLELPPANVPVEGYYGTHPQLTIYFRLMRALQNADDTLRPVVADMPAFQRLEQVTSSSLFGTPENGSGKLLPRSVDVLGLTLNEQAPDWSLERIVHRAQMLARQSDETSLVAIAALTGDAIALTALRESVVLYAGTMLGAAPVQPEYDWQVDAEIQQRAARFVETFNNLFGSGELPNPAPENAGIFWDACEENHVVGRCVALGKNPFLEQQYYHWAIYRPSAGERVHEFWASEIWTTDRYSRFLRTVRLGFDLAAEMDRFVKNVSH